MIRLKSLIATALMGACCSSIGHAEDHEEPARDPETTSTAESSTEETTSSGARQEAADRKRAEDDAAAQDPTSSHLESRSRLPSLSFGGFGDVNYAAEWVDQEFGADYSSNRFILGPLDLFLTSQLSERFSFLAEILFEFEEQGENIADVERLLLKYDHADWLNVTVGRAHTPIGYWNTHYHHGTWLQTTVSRPLIFEFEDGGGLLPMHYLGFQIGSHLNFDSFSFEISGIGGNGRGEAPGAIQLGDDLNNSKMFGVAMAFSPMAIPGLRIGGNVVADRIPERRTLLINYNSLDELIAGGYITYFRDEIEFLGEAQWTRHHDRGNGSDYHSWGGYVQAAYRFGRFKPYYRYDWLLPDSADPFYKTFLLEADVQIHTLGLRFDWAFFVALKLEYRHRSSRPLLPLPTTPPGGRRTSNGIIGQASFAF